MKKPKSRRMCLAHRCRCVATHVVWWLSCGTIVKADVCAEHKSAVAARVAKSQSRPLRREERCQ